MQAVCLGRFKNGPVSVKNGDKFILTSKNIDCDNHQANVTYDKLAEEVNVGNRILLDDGRVEMKVEEVDSSDLNIVGETQVNLTMLTPEINTEDEEGEEEDEDKELSDKELSDIMLEDDTEDTTKKITVTEEVNLDPETLRRKTVVQLKEIAAQKKLQKYKSLTKKKLLF